MTSSNKIKVAVRIRPKLAREEIGMCNICTRVTPGEPQIWLGHDKSFTFDHVFDMSSQQSQVYDQCVRSLVEGCFEGFNATVLAYGQTGSGKTYTMGTGFDVSVPENETGIIPRAVEHLFQGIAQRREMARQEGYPVPEFIVTAQFIEIYNEELIDLLCDRKGQSRAPIKIHEDHNKNISLLGVESKKVTSQEETLQCLRSGSVFRTTGATLMNAQSSRSHAIFTLLIKQKRVVNLTTGDDDQEFVTLTAKLSFVDLAGSERLDRTGAVGERAREGISINSGLLHLGNVISALGDRTKKVTHIPYRDSKLTRVLQDSLGGNSVTTMIACISPCDRDFVETLNTLRYANRAKNIKNKVVANQDSQSQLINELRRQLLDAQVEIQELKQGKLLVKSDGQVELNDVYYENRMLQLELEHQKIRNQTLIDRLEVVSQENVDLQTQLAMRNGSESDGKDFSELTTIKSYIKEINELKTKVMEYERFISHTRKQQIRDDNSSADCTDDETDPIDQAKKEVEIGKSIIRRLTEVPNHVQNENQNQHEDDHTDDEDNGNDELKQKLAIQNAELADLMESLASKDKLIKECEARELRMRQLTEQYERKIICFKEMILQIQQERDQLIQRQKEEIKEDGQSNAKREALEKKLAELQKEVKKWESMKLENQKLLHQETMSKESFKKMRQEILEMKQQKVRLIAQMKEQMARHQKEIRTNRMLLNKMTREEQKKIKKIHDLEYRSDQQKKMLQRREEEIKGLKKLVKPRMSHRVAGKLFKVKTGNSTPKKVRDKWATFQLTFDKIVAHRIRFEEAEQKLQRYAEQRQKLIDQMNLVKNEQDHQNDQNDHIDSILENIQYLSKSIEDVQNEIMHLEVDANINLDQWLKGMDADEIVYIMDKLTNSAISYAITASRYDDQIKATGRSENLLARPKTPPPSPRGVTTTAKPFDPHKTPTTLAAGAENAKSKRRRLAMTPSEIMSLKVQPRKTDFKIFKDNNKFWVKSGFETNKNSTAVTSEVEQVDSSSSQEVVPDCTIPSGILSRHPQVNEGEEGDRVVWRRSENRRLERTIVTQRKQD